MADYRAGLEFNPLDYPQSLILPKRFGTTASHEHIPFIKLLVHLLRPKVLVELGVYKGDSYLSICEAVAALGMKIACHGIDTWKGDNQTGFYDASVLTNLRAQHDALYGHFSQLVESKFDEAAAHFSEGSIELLHIDGQPNYEAVCHDWEAFRPKMSRNGVVLFHFTNRRDGNYGVWKLWEQLRSTYRHFEFLHGHGLGVLVLSPGISEALNVFLTMAEKNPGLVRSYFFALGNRVSLHAKANAELVAIQALEAKVQAFDEKENAGKDERAALQQALEARAADLDTLKRSHGDEVARLERLSQARADEITTLKRLHAEEITRLEAVVLARSGEVEKLTESIRLRSDEVETLQRNNRSQQTEIKSLKAQIQALGEAAEKLNALNQSRADDVVKLEQLVRTRAEEIETLKRNVATHVDEIDALNRLCQSHVDDNAALTQAGEARAKAVATLEIAAREHVENVGKLTRQCRTHEEEIARLTKLHQARTEDVEKLEAGRRKHADELDERERMVRAKADEVEKQARTHADALAMIQREHANSVAALERLRADDAAKHERLTAKVHECEDALRRRDVDALAQGEKLAALQTELEKLKAAKALVESDPSFKVGRTILAPFRFFSQKTNTPKPLPRPRE